MTDNTCCDVTSLSMTSEWHTYLQTVRLQPAQAQHHSIGYNHCATCQAPVPTTSGPCSFSYQRWAWCYVPRKLDSYTCSYSVATCLHDAVADKASAVDSVCSVHTPAAELSEEHGMLMRL